MRCVIGHGWGLRKRNGMTPGFWFKQLGGCWCHSQAKGREGWGQVWERVSASDLGPEGQDGDA